LYENYRTETLSRDIPEGELDDEEEDDDALEEVKEKEKKARQGTAG